MLPEQFKVWAFVNNGEKHGDNYFGGTTGDKVTRVENNWTPETPRYWPKYHNDNWSLDFFAFADFPDYSLNVECTKSGDNLQYHNYSAKLENFKIDKDFTKQTDPLYAVNIDQKETNSVKLEFVHALSQICFKAQNNDPNTDYKIYQVDINRIDGQGDFTIPNQETQVSNPSNSATSSYTNWTIYSNDNSQANYNTNYDSNYHSTTYTTYFGENNQGILIPKVIPASGSAVEGKVVNLSVPGANDNSDIVYKTNDSGYSTEEISFRYSTSALNLMPQKKDAATFSDDESGNSTPSETGTYLTVHFFAGETYKSRNIPISIDWLPGYRYIYTLKFTQGNLVAYTVAVADRNENINDPNTGNNMDQSKFVLMRKATNSTPALYVAKCNLGTTNETSAGNYYKWGALSGTSYSSYTQFSDDDNDMHGLSVAELTNKGWVTAVNTGTYETTYTLAPEKDAAQYSMKGYWRIPTKEDWNWLKNSSNCDWEPVIQEETEPSVEEGGSVESKTVKKLKGFYITSRQTQGKIYLPATGYVNDEGVEVVQWNGNKETRYLHDDSQCFYWTSTSYNDTQNAYYFNANVTLDGEGNWSNNNLSNGSCKYRYYGLPIRPVSN